MFPFNSIKEYQQQLLNNNITCVDTVKSYLQQIESNKHLNAFIEVFEQDALQLAVSLDAERLSGKKLGKLHGVIVSIKDVICYKGHQVSAASKILENYTAVYNATLVEKLLQEGAIIIGRNNCDEFAMGSSSENSFYGIIKNGIDVTRVPGGSSGGSAVAVQMNMSMISLGSDTGGSVRQPADFCGIVGLKPTYGRISRYGLIAYASSFDQIGIFAQSIDDASLALEVIAGADDFDSTASQQEVPSYSTQLSSDKKYKFAYFKQAIEHAGLDKEMAAAIKKYFEVLTQNGHTVEAVEFDLLDETIPTYYVLTTAEASSNLARFDGVKYGYRATGNFDSLQAMYKQTRSEGFGKEVQRRIMLGAYVLSEGYFDAYFTKAQQVRQLLSNTTKKVFEQYDAILSPTVPTTAFKIGEKSNDSVAMYLADLYTVFSNLVGIPAVCISKFKHSNGMPFGLQIMGKHYQETEMLSMAKTIESTN
ncbi:MAG: Asp-tRNA(Asn)/Glu-tRNA(Gln) amidotransferase subunit GatA [Bacteroidetes bacterium]|nr:Asp-tRNA(Asn)/Glu-tRNA(Gln) amidotransferase subunit GatA [Bacteroidota bacterium]